MEIPAPDFDLALTLDSGQTFHWESLGAGFVGTIGEQAVYRRSSAGARSKFAAAPRGSGCAHYFALDHPLAEICASFPDDPAMHSAAQFCRGLRIIRQPRWECLASFITSSMKQVAHIRQMSARLRQRFGARNQHIRNSRISFPGGGSAGGRDGGRVARVRAGLSGEEPARDGAARGRGRGRSRSLVRFAG